MRPWPLVRTADFVLHERPSREVQSDLFYDYRTQNLDGDEPVQVRVPGLVDYAHAAAAESFDDLVMQDGASDHGITRISGVRVRLYRGKPVEWLMPVTLRFANRQQLFSGCGRAYFILENRTGNECLCHSYPMG